MAEATTPTVSVVVPTYNRRDRLERVLRSLAAQDIDEPFEVVVASDGSTDGTDEFLNGGETPLRVTALNQPNQGPAAARNLGVEHARGDLVVFIDDDVVADAGLLSAHCKAHERLGERVVVVGPMLDPPDHTMSPWVAWEQEMLAKQYLAMDRGDYTATARQFYTGNASLRIDHLRSVGGFDPSFRRAEDVELAFRLDDLGLTFHYEPEAIGLHYAERSYDAWRRTAYDYGRNDVVFARDLGRTWLFEFIRDSYRWRNPIVRRLIMFGVGSDRSAQRIIGRCERLLGDPAAPAVGRTQRYALSVIYGIEYHRGIADELGSVEALRTLLAEGAPPSHQG